MSTFFVTIGEDIVARNILDTDFASVFFGATVNDRVVLLVQPDKVSFFQEKYKEYSHVSVEGFTRSRATKIESLLMSLARSGLDTHTNLWSKMRSYKRGDSSFFDTYIKRVHTKTLAQFGWYKNLLRKSILKTSSDTNALLLIDKYKPDALLSLSLTNFEFDVPIAKTCKQKKIPIYGCVRSWDNLSSHGLLRVLPDKLFLQNSFLKEMARGVQVIPESVPIELFGVPHYDALFGFTKPQESRDEFCKRKGLDSAKKILSYGAMGTFLFMHEAELPEVFEGMVSRGDFGPDVQVLYRAHPKFMINDDVADGLQHVVMDTKGKYVNTQEAQSKKNQNEDLVSILYYSDVVLTGASTIAIDGAVLNRPIVCIAFDGSTPYEQVNYWESVRRFYDLYTHFEELVQQEGVVVAYAQEELGKAVCAYMETPELHAEGRKKIVERFIEPFDGNAGKRLAQLFVERL
ncbi:MAG: CDP-glycerol glycerophosphotransferase family protein [Candidatus Paceibacterota bacterium]